MKYILLSLLLFLFLLTSKAQPPVKLYDEMCDLLQSVYCDYVREEAEVKYMSSAEGQYVGQLIDNKIYGWGYFLANDGSQIFGQFRNGKHVFGITLNSLIARVGGEKHFVDYDLSTGKIVKIQSEVGPLQCTASEYDSRSFRKITYANGDVYFGEESGGKRHGYGIYYWANGDFWYGEYKEGYRQGFGALFKPDHRLFFGKWVGDHKME